MLENVRYLQEEHNDGRLFKMFEDTVLSLVVKNYMTHDYVVGNPPYVNIKNIPESKQDWYKQLYNSAYGRFDLYVLFLERGLDLLSEDGKLGYITSNKFTRSRYGKNIRRIISTEYSLSQYVEFGDIDVFSDATNFASILIMDSDEDRTYVPYAKVHEAGNKNLFESIRNNLGDEEILTESLEVSTYPLSDLTEDNWRFTPHAVRRAESEIRDKMHRTLEDISLGVREGVASGEDDAFMISPEYAEENDLEESLLWSIIRGRNVRRWGVEWNNELVIYPYDESGDLVELDNYPNIKAHLDSHEELLKDRYCIRKGGKGIYEYHGPHPKSMFEGDIKIATPDMATENHFSYTNGYECFKNTVYVLTFGESIPYSEKELLGLLNSSLAEFSIKQTSPPLRGKPFRYRYKSQYVNQIPLPKGAGDIGEKVDAILDIEAVQQKIEQFPESYLEEYEGEVSYIDYTWQTNRNPVESSIQEIEADHFSVTAGRTDEIVSPVMDTGDEAERGLRARYVHNAVDGRSVKSGEQTSIPVPKSGDSVQRLLNKLEDDRNSLEQRSINELESEIDQEVYDLFDLSEDSQEILEKYLNIF
jgi:hypothetical protein